MRVAIVPGALALLPQYAGLSDPIAELRLACQEAVAWLLEEGPTSATVIGDVRIGEALLPGIELGLNGEVVLVVANGSARRGEKAPGHLDERSFAFDEAIGHALRTGDAHALGDIDEALGEELMAAGLPGLGMLSGLSGVEAKTWYDADPFGVQYWVVTWACES